MHHGVDPALVAIAEAGESVDHLPVVGEVDLEEAGSAGARHVHPEDLVTGGPQLAEDHRAELAGRAGQSDAHRPSLPCRGDAGRAASPYPAASFRPGVSAREICTRTGKPPGRSRVCRQRA